MIDIKDYIDNIFKANKNKELIEKYVFNEIDILDINLVESHIDASGDLFHNLLEDFFSNSDEKRKKYFLRLFEVISKHNIENIYIFEIIIIYIILGSSIEEAIFRYYDNMGAQREKVSSKIMIICCYAYIKKFFLDDLYIYADEIYNLDISALKNKYEHNILIPIMSLTIDSKYYDKIYDISYEIDYIESIILTLNSVKRSDKLRARLLYLIHNDLLNGEARLLLEFTYAMVILFLNRRKSSEYFKDRGFDEFLLYVGEINLDSKLVFFINYFYNYYLDNTNKNYSIIRELYSKNKDSFYSIYNIIKNSTLDYTIELKVLLTNLLLFYNDKNADITLIDSNINYFIERFKGELNIIFNKTYTDIIELLNSIKDIYFKPNNVSIKYLKQMILSYNYSESAFNVLKHLPHNIIIEYAVRERSIFYDYDYNSIINDLKENFEISLSDIIYTYINTYPIYIFKPDNIIEIIRNNIDDVDILFGNDEFLSKIKDKTYAIIDFLEIIYKRHKNRISDYTICYSLLKLHNVDINKVIYSLILNDRENNELYLTSSINDYDDSIKLEFKKIIKYWNCIKFHSFDDIINYVDEYYDFSYDHLIDFIDNELLGEITLKDDYDVKIPIKVLKYIFIEYLSLDTIRKLRDVDCIISFFDIYSFRNALENVYNYCIKNNIYDRYKNIIVLFAIYADKTQINNLYKQILIWEDNFKTSLVKYIIPSIVLNGNKYALLIADEIYKETKNNNIKRIIKDSFVNTAKSLNIPLDSLYEKLIPDLGFNYDKNIELDYGCQKFRLQLLSYDYIEIIDDINHKIIKDLPDAISDDDLEKVESAKKEFLYIKNSLNSIIPYQINKLKKVLMNRRRWDYKTFFDVFINNPIMNSFAVTLIWAVYDLNNEFITSFRVMEDNSFAGIDESYFELPEEYINECYISLYNPIDNTDDYTNIWKEQLSLYEISQPIEQLEIKPFDISNEYIDNNSFIYFKGRSFNSKSFYKFAQDFDMKVKNSDSGSMFFMMDDVSNIMCRIYATTSENDTLIIDHIKFFTLDNYQVIDITSIDKRFLSTFVYYISFCID